MAHISIDDIIAWLVGEITGLTNAFKQVTITTGLTIDRSLIMLVHRIEWFIPMVPGADGIVTAQLTRTSQTVVLAPSNPLVHAHYQNAVDFTTTGQIVKEMPKSEIFVTPMAIAQPYIYFNCTPPSTPSPDSAYVRLGYTLRSVSEKDFFRLAQSLTI